jgi:hypothetical protein
VPQPRETQVDLRQPAQLRDAVNRVAEQLGATSGNIIWKLAAYGVIEKTRGGAPVCSFYNVRTSSPPIHHLTAAE